MIALSNNKHILKFCCVIMCIIITFSLFACSSSKSQKPNISVQDYSIYHSTATDQLGRSYDIIDGKTKDKYVGMFFTQWHNAYDNDYKIYDLSLIRRQFPNDEDWIYIDDKEFTPMNGTHYIAEPLYGYYSSSDEWVLRRQLEMMTFAGIDFIMLDVTNGFHYASCREMLLRIICEYRQKGWAVPQVSFMMNDNSKSMLYTLYHDIYEPGLYNDALFKINGKAYVTVNMKQMNDPNNVFELLTPQILDKFTMRHTQWPTEEKQENAMPWADFGFPLTNYDGAMSVGVGVHAGLPMSDSDLIREDEFYRNKNWGRGYDHDLDKNVPSKIKEGIQFEQAWDWAIKEKDNVDILMVSSWNEWIVGKHRMPTKPFVGFVDTFSYEYSKDIEMMKPKAGYENYGDNFYLQLNRNIREFISTGSNSSFHQINTPKQFGMNLSSEKWADIGIEFADFTGEVIARDCRGFSNTVHYTDNSNRNDIDKINVVSDQDNLYMMVQTVDDIIKKFDTNWMNILLKTNDGSNWNGYNYVINRYASNTKTSLERQCGNGYNWEKIADLDIKIEKNRLIVKIPLKDLNLNKNNFSFDFKVTDNLQKPDDITDYYLSGDSAPIGRINYRYNYIK